MSELVVASDHNTVNLKILPQNNGDFEFVGVSALFAFGSVQFVKKRHILKMLHSSSQSHS